MFKDPKAQIIIMIYLSLFVLGLTDNLRGTLFPEILNTFSLSSTHGSYLFVITSVFSIIASYTSHQWIQRLDALQVWRWGVLLMGLGTFGFFIAPQFTPLLFSGAVLGLGFGILAVTQNLLITTIASPQTKQKILSGLHSMYGFAAFLAPLLAREMTNSQFPWKYLFLLAALLIFLLYIGILVLPASRSKVSTSSSQISPVQPVMHALPSSNGKPLLLTLIISCYFSIELLMSTRMTSYLKFHYQWTLSQSSLYLTYFFIGLLAGRVFFIFFTPPLSTKKMLLLSLVSSLIVITLGLKIDPLFLSLSGLFLAPFYPLSISFISELFPNQVSSVLSKTISLQSLFFISMNLIIGYWTDLLGIASAMNFVFILGGAAWLLLMKL